MNSKYRSRWWRSAFRPGLLALALTLAILPFSFSIGSAAKTPSQSSTLDWASSDGVWTPVEIAALAARVETSSPDSYRVVGLNREALSQVLMRAPMEFTPSVKQKPQVLSLPMPDGSVSRFRIEESPSMEPGLAAQFPEVKSYRGQGIDDPTATTRFDWSPLGFHATILSEQGSLYIDPYTAGDTEHYISYYRQDLKEGFNPPVCDGAKELQAAIDRKLQSDFETQAVGTSLRTYRLALATTVEYTNNSTYGGGKASTLTKLNTIVNSINAIYEREFSIRLQLIAGELSILFDSTDSYTNGNTVAMANENPGVLNGVLGSGGYDIGHVFGLGSPGSSAGLASVGVVCGNSLDKGGAASVLGIALVTGNFNIDVGLVAHEWGHQFNALHSFNSSSGLCGGQRSGSAAFETGSGSTIMSYAGNCSPENLQNLPDNYFYGSSFDSVSNYAAGFGACAASTATGNNPPTVSAGPDFTIPVSTPFTLTASGSDPDGDFVTYSWEQMDLGAASPPMTDNGNRPLVRSFNAVTSPSRTFPKVSDLLNNTSTIGEVLPTTTRTMTMRVTGRDNRAAGGGVNNDTMVLNVTSAAGPFLVTSPNTATTWTGGSSQTVTWNVANTSAAPVNCANVKISLSINNGATFPIVLAASTPNDGSASITVPNLPTFNARIKVQAVGNVFFDISNTVFTIAAGAPGGSRAQFDLDGDGKSDIGFYRNGLWGVLQSAQSFNFSGAQFFSWGGSGLQPVVADFDGDGRCDIAHMVPPAGGQSAAYSILRSTSNYHFSMAFFVAAGFPSLGDTPMVGDFDADGRADPGIWRASTGVWIIPLSSTNYSTFIFTQWGQQGDVPIVGDIDGDWKADIGFYRNGTWGFLRSSMGFSFGAAQFFSWGGAGLQPVVADFDGDGRSDIAHMVPPAGGQSAAYAILKSSTNWDFGQALFVSAGFPALGDTPVIGDVDGDGKADPGIWRASQGIWIIPLSSSGYSSFLFTQWGQNGDKQVPPSAVVY